MSPALPGKYLALPFACGSAMLYPEVFVMLAKLKIELKPETVRLLRLAGIAMAVCYAAALLLYRYAGVHLDYQLALIFSERLVVGLRAGFGLLCLGFLLMECK